MSTALANNKPTRPTRRLYPTHYDNNHRAKGIRDAARSGGMQWSAYLYRLWSRTVDPLLKQTEADVSHGFRLTSDWPSRRRIGYDRCSSIIPL